MELVNQKPKIQITVNIDPVVLSRIDEIRGVVSRSSFVNDALYWGFIATDEQIENCNV